MRGIPAPTTVGYRKLADASVVLLDLFLHNEVEIDAGNNTVLIAAHTVEHQCCGLGSCQPVTPKHCAEVVLRIILVELDQVMIQAVLDCIGDRLTIEPCLVRLRNLFILVCFCVEHLMMLQEPFASVRIRIALTVDLEKVARYSLLAGSASINDLSRAKVVDAVLEDDLAFSNHLSFHCASATEFVCVHLFACIFLNLCHGNNPPVMCVND